MDNDEGIYEVPGEDFHQDPEVDEAIRAGKRALACLDKASDYLDAASGWGAFDILVGGFVSGVAKHERLSKAQGALTDAREAIADFERELNDVPWAPAIDRQIVSGFWTFADILLDGPISDLVVQKKIEDARENVANMRSAVAASVRNLQEGSR